MVYIFNEIDKVTYDDYLKLKELNNGLAINKDYIKYEDRLRHELCIYLLKMYLKSINKYDLINSFKYSNLGRPEINEFKISFSKSNNGIIIGIDKEDIGVDIEDYSKEYIITNNLFLSTKEIELINNSKDYIFFINSKESFLKSKGLGIIDGIYKLDYSKYYMNNNFIKDNLIYQYYDKDKYSYMICSNNKQKVEKISYEELRRSIYE